MTRKFILNVVLSLIATMFVNEVNAQYVAICGKRVTTTGNITGDWLKNGIIYYDEQEKSLTLDNVTIESTKGPCISNYVDNLTIKLIGENSISAKRDGDMALGVLATATITGGGTLKTHSDTNCGILLGAVPINIKECTVIATGVCGIGGYDGFNNEVLAIENATVKAQGTNGSIYDIAGIVLKGSKITKPENAVFDRTWLRISLNGKVVTDEVVIEPAENYEAFDIWICGKQLDTENCADIKANGLASGKMTYDYKNKTLTLDNVNIETNDFELDGQGIDSSVDGLKINLIGNNNITAKNSTALNNGYYEMTIEGDGSLTATGGDDATSNWCVGMLNAGTMNIKGCSVTVSGAYVGLAAGKYIFDNCTVKAKGGNGENNNGSISWLWSSPEFINCRLAEPADAQVTLFKQDGINRYMIADKNENVITDWVTISPSTTGVDSANENVNTDVKAIYNAAGYKQGDLQRGINIIKMSDGTTKKVVK